MTWLSPAPEQIWSHQQPQARWVGPRVHRGGPGRSRNDAGGTCITRPGLGTGVRWGCWPWAGPGRYGQLVLSGASCSFFPELWLVFFLLLSFIGTAGALHGGFVKHSSPPGDSANSCCGSSTISPFLPSFKLSHFLVSKAWPAVQIKSWHR